MPEIKDHVLVLGFDDSQVQKGISKTEQKLEKLQKKISGGKGGRGGGLTQTEKDQRQSLKNSLRLSQREIRQKRAIETAHSKAIIMDKQRTERLAQQAQKEQENLTKLHALALDMDKKRADNLKRQGDKEAAGKFKAELKYQKFNQNQQKAFEAASLQDRVNTIKLLGKLEQQEAMIAGAKSTLSPKARAGDPDAARAIGRLDRTKSEVDRLSAAIKDGGIKGKEAFAEFNRKVSLSATHIKNATNEARSLTKQLTRQSFPLKAINDSLRNMARRWISVFAIVEGGKALYHLGKDLDSLQASLLAASGDTKSAAENFTFLKETSRALGRDLKESFRGFNRMGMAAKSLGYNTDEMREIFLASQEASTAFALDTQRSGLVMLAFSQMMSKGRVSMEEMSRQLGESLPVAMEAGARATGKTIPELIKLIETGQLMSKDFVLPFAKEMRKMVRETGALEAGMKKIGSSERRLIQSFQEFTDAMFQNYGIAEALKYTFQALDATFKTLAPLVGGFVFALTSVVRVVGFLVDGLDTLIRALSFDTFGLSHIITVLSALLMTKWLGALLAAALRMDIWLVKIGLVNRALVVMKGLLTTLARHPLMMAAIAIGTLAGGAALASGLTGGKGIFSSPSTMPTSSSSSSSVVDNRQFNVSVSGAGGSPDAIADVVVDRIKNEMGISGSYA